MTSKAQKVLFEPIRFDVYKFPLPQYLGAKFNLLSWIAKFVPDNVNVALDAFAGSQSVAFLLKQRELQVYTNDFLAFCHQIGKSLIENKNELLSDTEASSLFELRADAGTLMQDNFIGNFFLAQEAKMLDSFRANVEELGSPYKRAMALTVMNRSLTRRIIMGHFAYTLYG